MGSTYKILEEGKEVSTMAQTYNVYYLLERDELLRSQTEIGFCKNCAAYTWVEDLTNYERDEEDDLYIKIFQN